MYNLSIILSLSMYMYTISFILPVLKGILKTFVQYGVMEIPRSWEKNEKLSIKSKLERRKFWKICIE